jgi:hypothetical protein
MGDNKVEGGRGKWVNYVREAAAAGVGGKGWSGFSMIFT